MFGFGYVCSLVCRRDAGFRGYSRNFGFACMGVSFLMGYVLVVLVGAS